MKQNKFTIIVPSFNNEEWVENNLASILNQTYTNYRVIYIDDASTDETYSRVVQIVGDLPNWKVLRNIENKGAAYNYIEHIKAFSPEDNEILVHLDGDDWFYDERVLDNLNSFYNKKDCWMTYGDFVSYDGTGMLTRAFPQGTPHHDYIHKHKLYRVDEWKASHLRTYKYFLWKAMDEEDLISKIDGKYFWHATDLAWAYPCMEMCSKDKIGVVNFLTYVYNTTPKNQARTKVREAVDNSKFEYEIRNKKKYKKGIGNGKLPQINVYGDYMETHTIPTDFTYCYYRTIGDYDAVLLQDDKIIDYVLGVIEVPKGMPVIARVAENKHFFNQMQVLDAIHVAPERFDLILTWDQSLLEYPNARFCPLTDTTQFNILPDELPVDTFQMYPKTKTVSAITSAKAMVPGHITRLEFIASIQDKVDLFGRGIREIPSKLDGLKDYGFSIAIENAVDYNYFTEKITDCFLTGTIPIYYGCPNIEEFFDINGIMTFSTQEELDQILNSLTRELYDSKLESIKENFKRVFKYPTDTNSFYKLYYNEIL